MQYSKKQKQKSKEAKKELRKEEMKKEKKEPPRYQKNEPVREKDDGEPQLGDYSDEEESAPNKADGLADMMAKILGQNTGNKVHSSLHLIIGSTYIFFVDTSFSEAKDSEHERNRRG